MSHHLFYNKSVGLILFFMGVGNIAASYNIEYLAYLVIVQLRHILPFWVLGLLAGAYISTYGRGVIVRLTSEASRGRSLFGGLLLAAVLGAISPVTMYGMIPVLAAFLHYSVKQSVVTSFIVTSILINPNVFIYSFALGADIAVLRLLLCITAGVLSGVFAEIMFKGRRLYKFDGLAPAEAAAVYGRARGGMLGRSFRKAAVRTAPNLALGIFLAALFQVYFPSKGFDYIFSKNNGLSVLFAASLGVPTYYCGGGTIPLIKAWMTEGMSVGSALAFMITGPATKFTNMAALRIIMPAKSFVYYLIYNIALGIGAGMIIDLVYSVIL